MKEFSDIQAQLEALATFQRSMEKLSNEVQTTVSILKDLGNESRATLRNLNHFHNKYLNRDDVFSRVSAQIMTKQLTLISKSQNFWDEKVKQVNMFTEQIEERRIQFDHNLANLAWTTHKMMKRRSNNVASVTGADILPMYDITPTVPVLPFVPAASYSKAASSSSDKVISASVTHATSPSPLGIWGSTRGSSTTLISKANIVVCLASTSTTNHTLPSETQSSLGGIKVNDSYSKNAKSSVMTYTASHNNNPCISATTRSSSTLTLNTSQVPGKVSNMEFVDTPASSSIHAMPKPSSSAELASEPIPSAASKSGIASIIDPLAITSVSAAMHSLAKPNSIGTNLS